MLGPNPSADSLGQVVHAAKHATSVIKERDGHPNEGGVREGTSRYGSDLPKKPLAVSGLTGNKNSQVTCGVTHSQLSNFGRHLVGRGS